MSSREFTRAAAPLGEPGQHGQGCTMSLQLKIAAMVVAHLPVESVAALALTCRLFHHQFMPQESELQDHRTRRAILAWLEKDIPSLYLCFRCDRLHTWGISKATIPPRHGMAQYQLACKYVTNPSFGEVPPWAYSLGTLGRSYLDFNSGAPSFGEIKYSAGIVGRSYLDFHGARLLMNRHLYGRGHGPTPIFTLNSLGWRGEVQHQDGLVSITSRQARIIGNELYLHVTEMLYHTQGYEEALRYALDNLKPRTERYICHHVGIFTYKRQTVVEGEDNVELPGARHSPRYLRHLPEELAGILKGSKPFAPVTGKVKSCPLFYTDWRVDIVWQLERRWLISLSRWHRLGDLRTPDDPKWHNCVSNVDPSIRVPSWKVSKRPGTVYCDWMFTPLDYETEGRVKQDEAAVAEKRYLKASFIESDRIEDIE